jgi:replicative DNA helicase
MLGETETTSRTPQRVPPNSERLERLVLGNMLGDADCLRSGLELLSAKDFYAPIRAEVFTAIANVSRLGKGVDTSLVLEALKAGSMRHAIAWDEVEACNGQPMTPDIEPHCKAIRRMSSARALIRACFKIAAEGCEPIDDFESYLDRSAQGFAEALRMRLDEVEIDNIGDLATKALAEMETRIHAPKLLLGMTTGLYKLDELLGGLRPGAVYVIASRPGMGKSTLGLQFSEQFAIKGKRVAFFSLEMSSEELALRAISSASGIDSRTLSTGDGLEGQMDAVSAAVTSLQIPIRLPKARRVTIDVISRVARREHMQHGGLGCIVVDYLQLVSATGKYKSREQEVAEISRGLKLLALELHVPVIAMAQLNRAIESRSGDAQPQLSDLRESGAIEQDADCVMFLHRSEEPKPGVAELRCNIIVAKHRGGPVGSAEVLFQRSVTRYVSLYQ